LSGLLAPTTLGKLVSACPAGPLWPSSCCALAIVAGGCGQGAHAGAAGAGPFQASSTEQHQQESCLPLITVHAQHQSLFNACHRHSPSSTEDVLRGISASNVSTVLQGRRQAPSAHCSLTCALHPGCFTPADVTAHAQAGLAGTCRCCQTFEKATKSF
jgi:hypothetical protein